MDLPRPSTPISLVNIKEFSMLNIPAIFDKDDEIGLQPNKRPISTVNVDKNSKKSVITVTVNKRSYHFINVLFHFSCGKNRSR